MNCDFKRAAVGSLVCLAAAALLGAEPCAPSIIPLPRQMTVAPGAFSLRLGAIILVDRASAETGRYLADELHRRAAGDFSVRHASPSRAAGNILLTTNGAAPSLGQEGYTLSVAPDGIVIRAPHSAGLFYGAQSLLQLLPPPATGDAVCLIPCVQIEDQPRFPWRGMMLDVSRHFFPKEDVEALLDAMAWHKLNTFHWHLVDDQAWRIEIKKYPRLTEVGAWRKSIGFGLDPKAGTAYRADGSYGGYYTQADIREVVAYAQARHIVVVPEIEMPGHASAALMAYPQFSCTGGPFTTDLPGGVFDGIYCVGNEQTYPFLQDILAEVFDLFPGPYIHIGGDEVKTDNWKHCVKCQAVLHRQGLTNESELEGYFIRRLETFINARHHNLIGWSEIREGGLAANATVMDWFGGAVEAATSGHDVVMSPLADCYFDHYQSRDHAAEPHSIGGYLPLSQVYAFEPMPTNLPAAYQAHILGAQANLWTEYIPNFKHVEYMVFPRLCALAEVDWSPRAARNWEDFLRRARVGTARLGLLGVNYRALK